MIFRFCQVFRERDKSKFANNNKICFKKLRYPCGNFETSKICAAPHFLDLRVNRFVGVFCWRPAPFDTRNPLPSPPLNVGFHAYCWARQNLQKTRRVCAIFRQHFSGHIFGWFFISLDSELFRTFQFHFFLFNIDRGGGGRLDFYAKIVFFAITRRSIVVGCLGVDNWISFCNCFLILKCFVVNFLLIFNIF